MSAGKEFQMDVAATEKERRVSSVCVRGTTGSGASDERRARVYIRKQQNPLLLNSQAKIKCTQCAYNLCKANQQKLYRPWWPTRSIHQAIGHSPSLVQLRETVCLWNLNCTDTIYIQESVFLVLQYVVTASNRHVGTDVVSHHCSDSDVLWHLKNCCIIIFIT